VRSSAAFPLGMAAKSWLFLAGSAENSLEFRYFRPEDVEIAGIGAFLIGKWGVLGRKMVFFIGKSMFLRGFHRKIGVFLVFLSVFECFS
jgi:hypothetical protein